MLFITGCYCWSFVSWSGSRSRLWVPHFL